MKINKRISQFFQLFGLLVLLWTSFLAVRFFLERNDEAFEFFVPKSAEARISLNGNKLITSTIFSTLIEKRDPKLALKVRALLLKNDNSTERKNVFIGADVFQTIQLFRDDWNNRSLYGLIIKIHNSDLWDLNAKTLFGANSFTERKGNTGLVLFSDEFKESELQSYYQGKKAEFLSKNSNDKLANLAYFNQNFSVNSENMFKSISAQADLSQNLLSVKGVLVPTDNMQLESQRYQLFPKHLNVSGRILPKPWNDFLHDFCATHLDSIPTIESFSMNYSGLELITTANEIVPLPTMDLILSFKKPFSIVDFTKEVGIKRDADLKVYSDYLKIGERVYYFKQLDEYSIYLGISKEPKLQKVMDKTVLSINGSPKELLHVKGSRFMTAMIKMSEFYKAFNELFQATDTVSLTVTRTNRTNLDYTGKFEFKKDVSATNEFLKFMLAMQ